MEAILRIKALVNEDRNAEQRVGRTGTNLDFGNVQALGETQKPIAGEQVNAAAAAAADVVPQIDVGSQELTGFASEEAARHQAGISDFERVILARQHVEEGPRQNGNSAGNGAVRRGFFFEEKEARFDSAGVRAVEPEAAGEAATRTDVVVDAVVAEQNRRPRSANDAGIGERRA